MTRHLRRAVMPHILCPGCAHGIALRALFEAVDRLGLDPDRVALVAGIGCSSRLAGYADFCTLHSTHGRAPAVATGLKLARPELTVLVITGDGDGLAIGGNHLIHAARRDVDLTCLLFNNAIYGMTGGQVAPTTPVGGIASTAPRGSTEPPFNACRLVEAAGASFVARTTLYEPPQVAAIVAEAIDHHGFSFVELLADCPVYYGRYNDLGEGPAMLAAMRGRDAAVSEILATKRFVATLPPAPRPAGLAMGVLRRG
ncbi:MAG TPA: thiamine pyrophosphate-dependent enzyme [Candidatus Eisenbacteria bacterium]|nr:thiamine pyrophosphate-dependent enzyme [Candidatus Eisenbacteria bacterium]